jgi:ParB family chromosome partitioning protein
MNKKILGKGLAALMGEAKVHYNNVSSESEFQYIDINNIKSNKDQPRKVILTEELNELADSIIKNGVLQPILVQKVQNNEYRIIAGERRWRAAQIAGLTEIPAIIKNYTDAEEFEVALMENIQRQDLNYIEEAAGYSRLIEEFGYTQEQIAKNLGKSRSYVANILRLNSLPISVQNKVSNNEISMGHAKALVGLENAEEVSSIIVQKNFSVRQTESYVKRTYKKTREPKAFNVEEQEISTSSNPDPELLKLEDYLYQKLGAKTSLESSGSGGKITIFFEDFDELDAILTKIG